MPTAITANGAAGKRATRVNAARRLRNILGDLRDANRDWDTLTAAQRNTALQKCVRATIAMLDDYTESIKERSGRKPRPTVTVSDVVGEGSDASGTFEVLRDGTRRPKQGG